MEWENFKIGMLTIKKNGVQYSTDKEGHECGAFTQSVAVADYFFWAYEGGANPHTGEVWS